MGKIISGQFLPYKGKECAEPIKEDQLQGSVPIGKLAEVRNYKVKDLGLIYFWIVSFL